MTAPTLLCLDCGNTRLKWGVYSCEPPSHHWLAQGALALDELAHLPEVLAALPKPQRIVGCIVANDTARQHIETCTTHLGAPLHWNISRAKQCGVHNNYDDPGQLGADRWAALIGARHLQGNAPCLVVMAGTATTIDHLAANGHFMGGLILPGIEMMRTALAHHTARLPLVEGDFQRLPRNTKSAIASGCLQATAGAIERMYAPLSDQTTAQCLLSGGAAEPIAPLLDIPLRHIENLVLEGLAQIALTEAAAT